MPVQSVATYDGAASAGMPFWRLQISNWGNRQTGTDADSLQYVTAPVKSAQYIAIGPDSTADEVILNYNDLAATNVAFAVPNPGNLNQISMTVGVNRPGIILGGPITIRTAISTQFADTYFKDGSTVAQNFGGVQPLFEAPNLQLLLYTELPTVPTLFSKRNDMYRSVETNATADVGAEALIGIWPVMGRTQKALYFRATGTLVATLRVGAISSFVGNTIASPTVRPVEDTVDTGAIDATTGVQDSSVSSLPMQWIAAYYTRTAGAGTIITNLVASDR